MRHIMHVNMSLLVVVRRTQKFAARWPDILFIGFQEHLARDFERLKALLGLPDSLALPTDEIRAHKNPAHLESRLDPEAVANLTAWYRPDYGFLAFCRHSVE